LYPAVQIGKRGIKISTGMEDLLEVSLEILATKMVANPAEEFGRDRAQPCKRGANGPHKIKAIIKEMRE
jgi:hypothetical protein